MIIKCKIKENKPTNCPEQPNIEYCHNCMYFEVMNDLILKQHNPLVKNEFKMIPPINTEKALRYNEGKRKWSLVHYESLHPMIEVLEYGCKKYAPYNWQKPMDLSEILESMQRHLAKLMDGEEIDIESGISHMGHIQCNALFYNYHKEKQKNG